MEVAVEDTGLALEVKVDVFDTEKLDEVSEKVDEATVEFGATDTVEVADLFDAEELDEVSEKTDEAAVEFGATDTVKGRLILLGVEEIRAAVDLTVLFDSMLNEAVNEGAVRGRLICLSTLWLGWRHSAAFGATVAEATAIEKPT